MVRLELVADFGKFRGQTISGVVVAANYDAIMSAALNKLKLPKKKRSELHLVLRDKYQGVKALSAEMDLCTLLRDGATIVVSGERPLMRLAKPPRWPWPCGETQVVFEGEGEGGVTEEVLPAASAAVSASEPPSMQSVGEVLGDWHGPWPVLQGDVRHLVRRAIDGAKGFLEKDLGSYTAFDYNAASASSLPSMFPNPLSLPKKSQAKLFAAVRRECRGLLVCNRTGMVLARRLPKFFNVDELEETKSDRLPPGGEATIKLDGSLVSPFLLDGVIRWAGKSAIVPAVESFANARPEISRVAELVRQNLTPLFEWCEVGSPVGVIGHSESRLVLIGVRSSDTGAFWPHERLRSLGCDVVETVPFDTLSTLISTTKLQTSTEGVVLSWPALGQMVKLKTSWWIGLSAAQRKGAGQPALALLSALETVTLGSIPCQQVWQAVLTGSDDEMSAVYGSLAPEAEGAFRSFAAAVERGVQQLTQELCEWAESVRDASDSDIAAAAGGWPPAVLCSYRRRSPGAEHDLRKFLSKLGGAGQVRALEALVGTTWAGGRQVFEFCGHLGTFERATEELSAHVLKEYLPRKLADYMGYPMAEEANIRVPRLYEPAEGKIKGLWERFVDQGIFDLRVDLQPRGKVFDFHGGDPDFAHWQVQFGTNDSCPRSTKAKDCRRGAFAGVLLRTGVDVEFGQLRRAFELSFASQKVVMFDPSPSRLNHVYMDLDGVLVDFEAGFQDEFGCLPEPKERWQYIERTAGFYEHLPWLPGARSLWDHVCSLGISVTVLTGVPEGTLGDRSRREKVAWVLRELGDKVDVLCCLSRDKPQHSGPGRLLIDDRAQKGWEAAGGRQILHRTVCDTLCALVDLGLGRKFSTPRDRVALLDRLSDDLRQARASAEAVALDVEWPPDRAGAALSQAALVQLAFRPSGRWDAFVLDALRWDEELEAFVRELLGSELPKFVFGPGDADRLSMSISTCVNLQQDGKSLAAQARSAGLLVSKAKSLQAADWSVRPLRDEQIEYAATDVTVLLHFYIEDGKSLKTTPAQAAGRNASVEFSGIFLTPDARKKLLRCAPPRFAEVVASHMTLEWMPKTVRGLSVGSSVKLVVEGVGCDDGVQAVAVKTKEAQPRCGHVTVSHRQDVAAVNSNALDFASCECLTLDAVIGVCVLYGGADRSMLPDKVMEFVLELSQGQPGQSERIEGLTDSQRHAVHLLAEELGLEHASEGKKGTQHRHITLKVPKRRRPQAKEGVNGKRTVVKDAKKFAAIFGDVPGLRLHGRVMQGRIALEPGIELPIVLERLLTNTERGGWRSSDRLVVILRGFPGSGKSSLANLLRKQVPSEIVSADDNWMGPDGLQVAHEHCHQAFLGFLKARRSVVIVDNTNVRKQDYSFYWSRAESEGYAVVLLEMVCESTTELEQLRKRSVHNVPGGAVGAMWARWEQDHRALRFAPHVPMELLQWLKEKGMVGRPPNTHLVMPNGPFLSIPVASRAEFHARHAAEWACNHISEIGHTNGFQLFFDIDGLSFDRLLQGLPALRALVGVPLVVTGVDGPPPGHHIFAPGRIVNSKEALDLRGKWLKAVPAMEGFVDDQLYRNPQLRLLGSRKVSKEGVDTCRVHEFLGRFDADWQQAADRRSGWAWHEVSIHSS